MGNNNMGKTLIVGLAAAATALLFAPKSGKELREDLKEQGLDLKDKAMDRVNELADEFKQTYQEVGEEMDYANPDPELSETIADIENDLYHPHQEKADIMPPEPTDLVPPHSGPTHPDPIGAGDVPVPPTEADVLPTAEHPVMDPVDHHNPNNTL